MLKIIQNRLLYFLPTLIIISLVAFFLSKAALGDPIDHLLPQDDLPGSQFAVDYYEKEYQRLAKEHHLDLPLFYFGLQPTAYPDTFHQIVLFSKKNISKKLIGQYGNWPEISNYLQTLEQLESQFFNWPDTIAQNERINFQRTLGELQASYQDESITHLFSALKNILNTVPTLSNGDQIIALLSDPLTVTETTYQKIKTNTTPSKLYQPSLHWFGTKNQYHRWITGLFTGDFGTSIRDGRPVFDKIKKAAWWTICINLSAIFIAFILSIPLGVFSAKNKDTKTDKRISFFLFFLYSIPGFWMAMLLVMFFTTPQYGMNWFASVGLGDLPSDAPFWDRFWERTSHLILPIFTMTYATLAFITRQVRGGMLDVLEKDFVKTARAKGLSNQKVIWRHAFRNALFPLITLVAVVFPAALAGSVVVEVIFNIPGMGRLMFDSILARDWNVVFAVLFIVALLNMVGNLVADILYRVADPRV